MPRSPPLQCSTRLGGSRNTAMRFAICVAALLALASDVRAARILGLFPHTGKSHQMVFEPLLERLADRGHHLTVVSFFPHKNPPANYTDVSLEGIAPIGVESLDLQMFENPNRILKFLGLERIVKQVFAFWPLDEMGLHICRRLVDWPVLKEALAKEYDLVIVESFNSDCMLGLAHVYGVKAPVIALSSSAVMPWSYDRIGLSDNPSHVPQTTTAFTTQMTFMQRLENTFLQLVYKYWFRHAVQLKEQEILEKHFGRKLLDLQELAKNTSLIMVNTHHSLHGVRPLLPGLVEVGGMHLDHSRKPIPHFIERFMNESDQGVVLLSFGSLIRTATMPKYKEEILVNALSKLKQRVIWKYENSEDEGTLNGNTLRVKWIPQYELLRHHKVLAFVAHGGLLGMTEAISAGKPMVVVPFFGDQPNNAAMAEVAGLAKVVSYAELSEKALSEALEKVLSAEMRLSARRASHIWADRQADPLDTAVYWTERVIRWGVQAPLHSASRSLTYIEYSLLDVAAAFVLAILTLIVILRFLLSMVPWFFGWGSTKEKLH